VSHLTDIQPFRSAKTPAAPHTSHLTIEASLPTTFIVELRENAILIAHL